MRNLKVLGLALVAMFAMSAVAATVASADDLTAESYPTTLTGKPDPTATKPDIFVTTAGNISCTEPAYHATLEAAATSVTATATYAGCTAFGLPAQIDMEGCSYVFTIMGGTSTVGDADLSCPAGKEVIITQKPTDKCIVRVKAQSDLTGTVTYSNIGAGATREVTIKAAITGIDYAHTKGSGIAACTTGTSTTGTLDATAVVTGDVPGGSVHRGVFLSNV
jgi:hypothetical protein